MIIKKFEKEAKDFQGKIAAELEKQRDEEIEMVIARLEDESASSKAQMTLEFESKLTRLSEQFQSQVSCIENQVLL
jgi:hypothetical protein